MTVVFHFYKTSPTFQYIITKMIIFCACKNLLNDKSLKRYQIVVLKGCKKFDLESWPRKQNGTTVATTVMILQVAINWRSVLQINILKEKLDFEPTYLPLLKKHVTVTIVDWCLHCVYVWQNFRRKKHVRLSDNLNQI